MSTLNVETDSAIIPYHSMASLKEVHTKFLKRYKDGETEELLNDIEIFIRRASATGALLDNEDDRYASQSLIDYWMTVLYRAKRKPPDATLADFDPSLSPKLDDSLCPYRGLNAFQEEDRDIFFGRQRAIDLIIEKMKEARLMFVVGPSGSGKSSLSLAGLIPALKNDVLPGSRKWQYFPQIVPGRNPLKSLVAALNKAHGQPGGWEAEQIEKLKADPRHLVKIIRHFGDEPAVLIVDQFEEVFTLSTDDSLRDAFINNLISLTESSGPAHFIILTLRTDFETYLVQHSALMSLFEKGQLRVTPLTANDLRNAIEEPAKRIGLKFEDGVVDALVKDILGEPEGLPLLQFTLLRLWKMREDGRSRITLRQYKKLGGARHALALTADEFYQSLSNAEQITVRRILLRLALPSGNAEVLRNPVKRESLYFEAEYRVNKVLNKLYEAGLVRITKGDTDDTDKIEVAHEALVRNWPRLVDWIEKERVSMRQRRRLTVAAEQWLEHKRDEGGLLGGSVLAEALQYEDLNDLEKEFVQASKAAVERAEQDKAEARLREYQLDRERLVAVEQRAKEVAKNAKRLRLFLTICVMLTLFSIGAAIVAFAQAERARKSELLAIEQWNEAEQEKKKAQEQTFIAQDREKKREEAVIEAGKAQKKAEDESEKAKQQARLAKSQKKRADDFYKQLEAALRSEREEAKLDKARTEVVQTRYRADAKLQKHQVEGAIDDYESLLTKSRAANDRKNQGYALSRLSTTYQMLGDKSKRRRNAREAKANYDRSGTMYKEAEEIFQNSLKEKEKEAGDDKLKAVPAYLELAQFYKDQGKPKEAEAAYLSALTIQESALTKDDIVLQNEFDNLVDLLTEFYNQEPKSQRLEKLYKRVLRTKLSAYDTANPMDVYDSYKKLADLYRERENYDEAANTYEEALKLIKRVQPQNGDPDLSGTLDEILNSLGGLYKSQGLFKEAENYYSQALANQMEKPSPENEDKETLAIIYSNLGEVQKNRARYDDALKNYNQAIKIYSADAKKNFKGLAASAIAAAEIHLSRKEYDEAQAYFKQASDVIEKEGGQSEKDQLTESLIKRARINYIYSVKSNQEESKKYHEAAVDLIKRALATSPNAPRMLDEDLHALFRTLKEQNFKGNESAKPEKLYEDMLKLYYEAIKDSDLTLARSPSDTADEFVRELAEIYRKQGNNDKLVALFNQALEIRKKTYKGTDNPSVYRTYNELGRLYQSLGKYGNAEDNYRQALEIVERVFSKDDAALVVDSLNNLAAVYRDQQKYSEAEALYLRAKSNLEQKGQGESTKMAEVLEGYADVLRKTDRAVEANKLQEDARRLRSKQANMK